MRVAASASKASSSSNEPGTKRMLSASRCQTSSRKPVRAPLLGRAARQLREVAVAPVAAGEADQREAGWQQAAVGEVVDGRDELLARQVPGDAEDDQGARPRHAWQPTVAGVAQRVVADDVPRRVGVRRDVDQRRVARGHAAGLPAASAASSSWRTPAARSVRCSRTTGRPAARGRGWSPSAWAIWSRPKVNGRPGTSTSRVTAPVTWRKTPDLRAALVELAGRVQEPRAPAERDRAALRCPGQPRPDVLGGTVAVPVEVGHHGEVAVVADRAHDGPQDADEVGGGAEGGEVAVDLDGAVDQGRLALGQRSVVPRLLEDLRGVLLRLRDVGLVERVDAEDVPGDGGGVLPEQELRAERAARPLPRRGRAGPGRARRGRRPCRRRRSQGRRRPRPRRAGSRCPACRWTRATSCSAQSPKPTMPDPASASTSLSRPPFAASPSARPSTIPGLPSSPRSPASTRASASSRSTSAPARWLGVRPNADSAL